MYDIRSIVRSAIGSCQVSEYASRSLQSYLGKKKDEVTSSNLDEIESQVVSHDDGV